MAIIGQKIANAPLGSFPVHSDSIDATGDRCQIVKLDIGGEGLSSLVTALNPLPVTGGGGGGGDVNIIEYGGTATTLGQKAMAASIPVVIASDQDSLNVDNSTLSVTGNGTEVGALRVTIADDTTGVVGITGNVAVVQGTASSLNARVQGNVASGATDSGNPLKMGAIFNTTQPTVTNGQRVDLQATNRGGLIVANGVDAFNVASITSSVVPGTGATNLGKAEDSAHTTGDTGVMALGVRNDANAEISGTDLDYTPLSVDSTGGIRNVSKQDAGTTLTAINTTYNNTTTTASSADITTSGYRFCDLIFTIVSANTPTDIVIEPEAKDSSTYFKMKNGFLGKFIFDDTAVSSAQNIHVRFPCPTTGTMRVTVTATGTTAANTFTISNAKLFLST